MKPLYLLLILSFTADVCAQSAEALYLTMAQRLSLMRDVAAYKWRNDLDVEDRLREQVVLAAALQQALNAGLQPATAGALFEQQIAAAKDIQRYWFQQWVQGDPPAAASDLQRQLRPELLALGEQIVRRLGHPVAHDAELFSKRLQMEGLSEQRITQLYVALRRVERYAHRLEQILATGVLRVGTTGDYAPFSYLAPQDEGYSSAYEGIDIDLAHDLARSLDVAIQLVPTSWPDLSSDLRAGRFDVAMSGVSRTLARARIGHLSIPYYVGGKTPIARCSDRRRFSSLDAVDQRGVRVIVNPGGTNEQYVDQHLALATKVLHSDNRSIFAALVDGKADVMITDRIEVTLQVSKHPALCATMEQTLTYQEKAFFMPADSELKHYVDTWLSLRLSDGTVNTLLDQHLQ